MGNNDDHMKCMYDNADLNQALQSAGMEYPRMYIGASSTGHTRVHETFTCAPPSSGVRAAIRGQEIIC